MEFFMESNIRKKHLCRNEENREDKRNKEENIQFHDNSRLTKVLWKSIKKSKLMDIILSNFLSKVPHLVIQEIELIIRWLFKWNPHKGKKWSVYCGVLVTLSSIHRVSKRFVSYWWPEIHFWLIIHSPGKLAQKWDGNHKINNRDNSSKRKLFTYRLWPKALA